MSRIVLFHPAVLASARQKGMQEARPLATMILTGAKTLAPVGDHRHGSGRRVAGPTLKASLKSAQISRDPLQIVFQIGSSLQYAATVHQGSKPHDITGSPLAFRWARARFFGRRGRRFIGPDPWLVTDKVRHPGNKRPRRYLTTPLAQFGRQAGFKVTTSPVSRSFLP